MKTNASTTIVLDRIEGDLAVLVLYDDDQVKFNLPVMYLPKDAKEGDHFRMSFANDDVSKDGEKNRIDNLLGELRAR